MNLSGEAFAVIAVAVVGYVVTALLAWGKIKGNLQETDAKLIALGESVKASNTLAATQFALAIAELKIEMGQLFKSREKA